MYQYDIHLFLTKSETYMHKSCSPYTSHTNIHTHTHHVATSNSEVSPKAFMHMSIYMHEYIHTYMQYARVHVHTHTYTYPNYAAISILEGPDDFTKRYTHTHIHV